MKKIVTLSIIVFWAFSLIAQDSNMVFSFRINYLPSSRCSYEYYIQNGQSVKHKYKKESKNCWDLKFSKGRKVKSISLNSINKFVRDLNSSDTLKVYLPKRIRDSLTNTSLTNSNYFENDSLTLIFSQFETEYYKPDSSMFGMPRYEGAQIDGDWFSANFICNKDTLLSVYKSYSGYPRVVDSKEWLTLYFVCYKYNLFENHQFKAYLSEEHFIYLLRLYLRVM